ncbi:helix-turn-helix domain-containing protein [Manganibacter manganicus]|uniref:helix-turn-helix domain-containing protein n=1 Tax=Manganibacter manganicus TaxID=1873176 RepID=UPI002477CEFB|nr:helix-turn-helix domain-containing protein [Pseudaminobacter manganicus]
MPRPTSSSIRPRRSRRRPHASENEPDCVDIIVGERLRARRQSLGMSQRQTGELIGVSYQQVQKYEQGKNRISLATLVRAAEAMDVPLSFFLEGVGPTLPQPVWPELNRRDIAIVKALLTVQDQKVRAALRILIRALAEE